MQTLRSTVYLILFSVWTAVVAVGFTPLLFGPRRWSHRMFNFWGKGVIALLGLVGIRVEVRGREHIPTGAALVAPKHQCMLDVFAQFTWLPANAFVMKKELAWIPGSAGTGRRPGRSSSTGRAPPKPCASSSARGSTGSNGAPRW